MQRKINLSKIFLYFFIQIFIFFCFCNFSFSKTTPEDAYQKVKTNYENLAKDPKLRNNRRAWLSVISGFRDVYLGYQKDEDVAVKALYMMGRTYKQLYENFKKNEDIKEAIQRFELVVEKYPGSSLSDDALFEVYDLQRILKNYKKSDDALCLILKNYEKGDKFKSAEAMLKNNKKLYDNCQEKIKREKKIAIIEKKQEAKSPDDDKKSKTTEETKKIFKESDKPVKVVSVRNWTVKDYTRVVIETTGETSYKYATLPPEGDRKHPRMYIDILNAVKSDDVSDYMDSKSLLLKGVRAAQNTPDTVRVVIDMEAILKDKVFTMDNPFRIIVDLVGTEYSKKDDKQPEDERIAKISREELEKEEKNLTQKQKELKEIKKTAKEDNKFEKDDKKIVGKKKTVCPVKGKLSLAQQLGLCVGTIVIDPGHGGKDPGAIGSSGLQEKDIVLRLSKYLREELEKQGFSDIHFTRSSDKFLPLEERTAIANAKKADLFISVHVNAEPQSIARGIETYFLNFATDESAMRTAALENAVSTKKIAQLKDILNDIITNNKIDESKRLAGFVQKSMVKNAKKKNKTVKDHGVKQAPFFVLIGAQMPAVLVEVSFISNQHDEKLLSDNTYLRLLARGIADGVKNYALN